MNNLLSLLSTVIGNSGRTVRKENEHLFFCPFCTHYKPKLQINLVTQWWHCWVCDAKGRTLKQLFYKLKATNNQFTELIDILGETSYSPNNSNIDESRTDKIIELPTEYIPLWSDRGNQIIKKHAKLYLTKRNISEQDIFRYSIGYCESGLYKNRIIIPSYDLNNKLNFFLARNIYSGGMKYKNPPYSKNTVIFENQINWNLPVVICEGVFDAIAIKRNAIPILGKTLPNKLLEMFIDNKVKKVILALDTDALKDAIKISERLSRFSINTFLVKLKDKDPSDEGFYNMITHIDNAINIDMFSTIKLKLNQL
ncbi:MAG: hypothetical protein H8E03_01450 [Pelagibacteraceae bacterium]|nr:hypothetical protein [Pelagibacteraceae bacterium]